MSMERKGVVTFLGGPLTLIGRELKPGDAAPEFTVLNGDLQPVSLKDSKGKVRLISVVPSLDTGVCDLQSRRFNEEAAKLPPNVTVLTVSMDLPFAQKRWCAAAHADRIQLLSDHRDASFGTAYGVLIKELRLLSRAVFVVGDDDRVKYVEYVPEVTHHPDYDKVLAFLKAR